MDEVARGHTPGPRARVAIVVIRSRLTGKFLADAADPFEPFRLLDDRQQFVCMLAYYLVLAAPFFCSGLAISLLLSRSGRQVNRLYAADLLGTGLGCEAICAMMPTFGGFGFGCRHSDVQHVGGSGF